MNPMAESHGCIRLVRYLSTDCQFDSLLCQSGIFLVALLFFVKKIQAMHMPDEYELCYFDSGVVNGLPIASITFKTASPVT